MSQFPSLFPLVIPSLRLHDAKHAAITISVVEISGLCATGLGRIRPVPKVRTGLHTTADPWHTRSWFFRCVGHGNMSQKAMGKNDG